MLMLGAWRCDRCHGFGGPVDLVQRTLRVTRPEALGWIGKLDAGAPGPDPEVRPVGMGPILAASPSD